MNRLARFAGFGAGRQEGVDRDETEVGTAATVPAQGDAATAAPGGEALREPIIAALREVHDPEIPVNIYDLGLIYKIDIGEDNHIAIDMTLTAPACPVAGMMPVMVKDAVKTVDGVGEVDVELVWDPPWSPDTMSDAAKLQLGML
ncbi:SUF system Fe-S cluster assembly protein [uncultured Thiohalocapsa sp.]|uniref:SUF system Fe-S cluster assembly protein n=1 Tax=uncultured Thiohalocapsa sp. TaxID=768990 RepID=UPI0025F4930F|nr:SUF system Fe-S cluster assembly protein [uncultured Thiohalocapsa sp.]